MAVTVTQENIFALTQSVIAIAVVVGGGLFFFLRPGEDSSAVVGVMGMVIGWYFRSAAGSQIRVQEAAQAAQAAKKP